MANHRTAQTRPEAGGENRLMPGGRWRVVPERSRVGFRVKKMGLYYVKGSFKHVEGEIEAAPDGSVERGDLTVEARTMSTRMPPRDWHLRSKDFLDVENHSQIRVTAEGVDQGPDAELRVTAMIELHGQRRPAELSGHLHTAGRQSAVLHLQAVLDRHDFGIRARQPFEWVVGRHVHLEVELALERVA